MAVADRLLQMFTLLLGEKPPVGVRGWDGSQAGPSDAPVLDVRSRQAIRRLVYQPNELGLGRAYVAGEIDVEGDLFGALDRFAAIMGGKDATRSTLPIISKAELLRQATLLGAVGSEPAPPPEEVTLAGAKHSRKRDQAAISHHYDLGNEFYRLVLGESMVYSCGYWTSPDSTLADAQRDKVDLICRKLRLRPGTRLLDVGCGWGSLAMHAAKEYGAQVVGVTLSAEQLEYARSKAAEVGLADQVEFRLQDYRDVSDEPFDAIASVGMGEHVGTEMYAAYCAHLFGLLRPAGRLLNHQISRHAAAGQPSSTPSFIGAYVFPDGALSTIAATISFLEQAGFEVRDTEALREHYTRTLRAWEANLEAHWDQAVKLTSEGRARVWRLYMTAAALSFQYGHIGVHQVLAVRPGPGGASGMPATRALWMETAP